MKSIKDLLKALYKAKPELITEHKRLVETLRHGSKEEQEKEAASQLKELKEMIKKSDSEEDKANEKKMKEKYKSSIEKPKTPKEEENEVRARVGAKTLKKADEPGDVKLSSGKTIQEAQDTRSTTLVPNENLSHQVSAKDIAEPSANPVPGGPVAPNKSVVSPGGYGRLLFESLCVFVWL